MVTRSRIGAVVDAVVALAGEVLDDVQVIDGPYLGELPAHILVLGVPDGDQPGYKTTSTRAQGFGVHEREAWQIHAMLSMTTGGDDHDLPALRDRAVDALARLDDALTQPVATPVWDRAGIGPKVDWVPLLDQQGAAMTVFFDIEGVAL